MAILANLPMMAAQRVDGIDFTGVNETAIYQVDGDIILKVKDKEISVKGLISRLEELERAYMEDKLLGKKDE